MFVKDLGKIIKKEREEWGVSKRTLAKLIGEEIDTIENIELGIEKNPNFYLILNICNILDISIFSILTKEGFNKFIK